MTTAIERRTPKEAIQHLRKLLEAQEGRITAMLPKHLTPERVLKVAMNDIQRTPRLLECVPGSVIGSIVQASELGLEVGATLGHAYLVPFRDRRANVTRCQLIIGYRGMVDLARRSGQIVSIESHVVREGDVFEFELGLDRKLKHIPSDSIEPDLMGKDVIAAYAVAHLKDGGVQFEVMWRKQIDAIKDQSPAMRAATPSGPWLTHYPEMARKCPLRRLFKMLPATVEMNSAAMIDGATAIGQFTSPIIEESTQQATTTLEALSQTLDPDGGMGSDETSQEPPEGGGDSRESETSPGDDGRRTGDPGQSGEQSGPSEPVKETKTKRIRRLAREAGPKGGKMYPTQAAAEKVIREILKEHSDAKDAEIRLELAVRKDRARGGSQDPTDGSGDDVPAEPSEPSEPAPEEPSEPEPEEPAQEPAEDASGGVDEAKGDDTTVITLPDGTRLEGTSEQIMEGLQDVAEEVEERIRIKDGEERLVQVHNAFHDRASSVDKMTAYVSRILGTYPAE